MRRDNLWNKKNIILSWKQKTTMGCLSKKLIEKYRKNSQSDYEAITNITIQRYQLG